MAKWKQNSVQGYMMQLKQEWLEQCCSDEKDIFDALVHSYFVMGGVTGLAKMSTNLTNC